jgi:GNAT superfamily N-acetyltransferase
VRRDPRAPRRNTSHPYHGPVHRQICLWTEEFGKAHLRNNEAEDAVARDLRPIIVPELVLIAEHEGRPIALSVTLPNVNEKLPRNGRLFPFGWAKLLRVRKTRHARLFMLGVHPDFRKRGIESLLCIETALRAKRLGYEGGEIGWTLEDNYLVNRAAVARRCLRQQCPESQLRCKSKRGERAPLSWSSTLGGQ